MNKERNKALIIALVGMLFVLVFESAFIYIWFRDLNILKINPVENKGNWLIASVYLVEVSLLLKAYGGLKIGHRMLLIIMKLPQDKHGQSTSFPYSHKE